jgi:DNA-binding LacI/PurR family transcriptional regulator
MAETTATQSRRTLTPHEARAVGVKAGTDPRTVVAYLANKPVRSTTRARIVDALLSLGFSADTKSADGAP